MHEFVSFNHQISHPNQVKLNGISSTAFYGSGIFTTLAIFDSKPFLWEKHWRRLTENAYRLRIDISSFSEETVKNSLFELLTRNRVTDGRARLTFFDECSTEIWPTENQDKTSLLIITGEFRPIPKNLSLTVSPYRVNSKSPIINTKSSNYLENVLASREAKERGFSEAVRLNENAEVVSACMANIFWVKDGQIFTPTIGTGALRGTMREFILENYTVTEEKITIDELKSAENIFLTSAGLGIAEIQTFDGQKYKTSRVIEKLCNLFHQIRKIG